MYLKQCEPARCDGKYSDSLWDSSSVIAEKKIDGSRYIFYHCADGSTSLIARGTKLDKARAVPHITQYVEGMGDFILDGEMVAPPSVDADGNRQTFGDTVAVMNSGSANALILQKEKGFLQFICFDVLMYEGKDVRRMPLRERLLLRATIVQRLNNPHIVEVESSLNDKRAFYETAIENGEEGIVLKNLNNGYGMNWVKVKGKSDVSVVITDVHPERMAVEISVYDNGKLVTVGDCGSTRLSVRGDILQNKSQYLGQVLDVYCIGLTVSGKLRNPIWNRMRPDVDPSTVTKEKLLKDFEDRNQQGVLQLRPTRPKKYYLLRGETGY